MSRFLSNKFSDNRSSNNIIEKIASEIQTALAFHKSIDGYSPTPLYQLKSLADQLGVKELLVKDESSRFGLNAFKALGASFAIYKYLTISYQRKTGVLLTVDKFWDTDFTAILGNLTFCTATDGNHGRAVAWMAKHLGFKAIIYMPSDTVQARIDNIKNEDAIVHVVDGDYDDAVKAASYESEKNSFVLISDCSFDNYEEIPTWISAGYSTIFVELEEQINSSSYNKPDIFFIQTGVGALAVTAASWFSPKDGRPKLVCVEPESAACLLESIKFGEAIKCTGNQTTIMAGLNCGTPSKIAFDIIQEYFDLFISVEDNYALKAMAMYANPEGEDKAIISGESGAGSLAGLIALSTSDSLKEARELIGLTEQSTILLINTEGATDPESYRRIIAEEDD